MTTVARWPCARVGATCVHAVTLDGLLEYCASALRVDTQRVLFYSNAHAVVLAEADADFRAALAAADVVFCDGAGVWLAARWLGAPLPARFTPPDWADRLGQVCAAAGRPLFLLGSTAEAVARAGAALRRMTPGLAVHTHHGYFDKAGPENEAVIAQINAVRPGALLVGFGMPAQELWITAHRGRLNANLLLAVGGMFDYLGGSKPRGPRWLTDRGFEWLCRLLSEPRRLGRRYLLGLPRFAWIVARQKFGHASEAPGRSQQ
jgi:N-acetylglucosaminyldiphosphoundecaprenol N-acetyl-beta-D-mannosaminyltransferase